MNKLKIIAISIAFMMIFSMGFSNIKVEAKGSTFNTVKTLTMERGASIRIDTPSGIRFTSHIDNSLLDTTNGVKFVGGIEIGMMVVPSRLLKNNFDKTTNTWKSDLFEFIKTNYGKNKEDFSKVFKNENIKSEGDRYVIRGVLSNIMENNYIQAYQAVSYYIDNEGNYNYSLPSDSRTIDQVASAALADTTKTFTDEQKAFLSNINTVASNLLNNEVIVDLDKSLKAGNVIAGENMKCEVIEGKLSCSAIDVSLNPREVVTIYFDKPCTKANFSVSGAENIVDLQAFPVISPKDAEVKTGDDYHPVCWAPTAKYEFDFAFPKNNDGNIIYGVQVSIAGQEKFATFSVNSIKKNVVRVENLSKIVNEKNILGNNCSFSIENNKIACIPAAGNEREIVDIYFNNPTLYALLSISGSEAIVDLQTFPIVSPKGKKVELGSDYHPVCWAVTNSFEFNFEFHKDGAGQAIYGVRVEISGHTKNVKFYIDKLTTDYVKTHKAVDLVPSVENNLIKDKEQNGELYTSHKIDDNGNLVITTIPGVGSYEIIIMFNQPISLKKLNSNITISLCIDDRANWVDICPIINADGGILWERPDGCGWGDNIGTRTFKCLKSNLVGHEGVYGFMIDVRPNGDAGVKSLSYSVEISYSVNEI